MLEIPETNVPIVIVAAMGYRSKAIGRANKLLWHVPEDLKRFKSLTIGHPVIMGRKTFSSIVDILGKPLPARTNIVVTSDPDFYFEDVKVANNLAEAIRLAEAEKPTEIHIGGGQNIYEQMLPYTNKLYLTYYFDDKEGDTHFPTFENDFVKVKEHPPQECNGLKYQWVDYERK